MSIGKETLIQNYPELVYQKKYFNTAEKINSFPCILKFYEKDEKKLPKMNDLVKVIGVLNYEAYSSKIEEEN